MCLSFVFIERKEEKAGTKPNEEKEESYRGQERMQ
jgi:hypothetical protein